MDPFDVLGLPAGASPEEVAVAYRRLAKRWHPDRRRGREAERRMAEINAAYDLLREGAGVRPPVPGAPAARRRQDAAPRRPPRRAGSWLPEWRRRLLGPELLAALTEGEDVRFVTQASTWSSPHAVLAVTDRRLLWLLDDHVTGRVRSLRFGDVADADHRLVWPRRRRAVLRVRARNGRRLAFADLRPDVAAAVAAHVARAVADRPRPARSSAA